MRPLALLLLLVSLLGCAVDEIPQPLCNPGASVACACPGGKFGVQRCDVTRVLTACVCGDAAVADLGAVDANRSDAGRDDAAAVDAGELDAGAALPCVPACAAGTRCELGACVAVDGGATDAPGDADVADVPLTDAALATLFRTCEPIGSECAPGVRCMGATFDAGTRGVCTVPCGADEDTTGACLRLTRTLGQSNACWGAPLACLLFCNRAHPCPSDGGYGGCVLLASDTIGVCAPL